MQNRKIKNKEVEIRAWLDDVNVFKNTLKKLRAKFIRSINIHDIYFCNKALNKIEDVEMNKIGSYGLRLRQTKEKNKKEKISINTKTITKHKDHNAWEEHEVEINNFSEMVEILETTEFKPFFELQKTRYIYKLDNMEICIEDIKNFGKTLEIEIMCKPGEEKKAKEKIKKFLDSCKIDKNKIVPKSITNIIMKERAFKQKINL